MSEPSPQRPGARTGSRLLVYTVRGLISLFLFAATIESLVRVYNPSPRYQIVRSSIRTTLFEAHGVPLWYPAYAEARWNTACAREHPDRPVLLIFGSSISYGVGNSAEAVFSSNLQEHYGETRCVMNYAQAGGTMQTKLGWAEEIIPKHPGADVLLEVWMNDPNDYTMLGGAAYALRGLQVDSSGYPSTLGIPAPLNGWLFDTSSAYNYATFAVKDSSPSDPEAVVWERAVFPRIERVRELALKDEGTMTVMMMPTMRTPLADQVGESTMYGRVAEWAEEHQLPSIEVARLLTDQDIMEIRLDPCCHLNGAGHEVLAARLVPHLP